MDSPPKPRICVSVCESTVAALEQTLTAAVRAADLIEVRLDCLAPLELGVALDVLAKSPNRSGCESILTFRAPRGDTPELNQETRQVLSSAALFPESLFDIELDVAERFISAETSLPVPGDWRRIICSHHDFAGVPADLDLIYERLAATPARVLKIAVQADDASDCLPVFRLLERARIQGREMIAIAMGTAGLATRILGPSRGAFLTYASLTPETETAPGQISVDELREVYRFEEINRQTQIFGLIGLPVSHSVSPHLHNAAFAAAESNAVYVPFEVRDVTTFLKRMIHPRTCELDWNIGGLSVTAPHKSAVINQLDWIEPAAREIGAVNTIVIEGEGLSGYNTDAPGFIKPLKQRLGDLREARCAVIGAGGVASAALWGLRRADAKATLFARNSEKAGTLAERFGVSRMEIEEANFQGFDAVINATPLGTAGQFENETPATAQQLRGAHLVYDLVYNPIETRFLREGRAADCDTLDGLSMLVSQAEDQHRLWTGVAPPEGLMYAAAERRLRP